MYERFTDCARKVMQLANQQAHYFQHEYITTEHILLGLLEEGSGVAANALKNLEIDLGKLYREIEKIVPPGPYRFRRDRLPLTPCVKQLIADALEESEQLDAGYVGTEHLLLALIRQKESVAGQVLANLRLTVEEVRGEVLRLIGREIPEEKSRSVPPRSKPPQPSAEAGSRTVTEGTAMYERFTDRARKVMQLANQEAQRFNHEYLGTEHILLGLVKEGSGVAAHVLKNRGIDLCKVRLEVEKIIARGPNRVATGKLPQTPRAKLVMKFAIEETHHLNHNYVGTEHLLLGLIRESEGVAAQVLMNLGLRLEDVRNEVLNMLGYFPATEEKRDEITHHLPYPLMNETNQTIAVEENRGGSTGNEVSQAAERKRIRSLEQQLWNVRVVLGALIGALAGVMLFASLGSVIGLLLGGVVAALGWRTLGVVAGGGAGAFLGCLYLSHESGSLAGALLGGLAGFLIAEIGRSPDHRGFLGLWRRR